MNKAVLLITFNRLDYVKETFEQIRIAKPPRLYLASDGPRENVPGEAEKVQEIRDFILNHIDWECNVKTRFLDKNSGGCAYGVSGAVTWFFENEEDGIILEDDCVPAQSFFSYCEELLDKYRDDKRIWHIAGDAPISNVNIKESYYFAKIQQCWGWASWADRWKYFKLDISDYDRKNIKKLSKRKEVQNYWLDILKMMKKNPGFTWDYQWAFIIVANNGYCINPTKNLISNIGVTGEHSEGSAGPELRKTLQSFDKKLCHPRKVRFDNAIIERIYTEKFSIGKSSGFAPKIFSVANLNNHKIITILGIKFKFKLKSKIS